MHDSFLALVIRRIDIKVLINELKNYNFIFFIIATIIAVVVSIINSYSLHVLYKGESVFGIAKVIFESDFLSLVMLGQIFSEASKVVLLPKKIRRVTRANSGSLCRQSFEYNRFVFCWQFGSAVFKINYKYNNKSLIGVLVICIVGLITIMNKKTCSWIEKIILSLPSEKIKIISLKYFC